MECEKPAKRGPNKGKPRTGTPAGYQAHKKAGEDICEDCKRGNYESYKAYRTKNAERISAVQKEYREKNADRIKAYMAEWVKENKEKKSKSDRRWREKNLEYKRANDRAYYRENAEKIKANVRKWHHDNKEYANSRSKEWRENNPDYAREYYAVWYLENLDKRREAGRRRRARKILLSTDGYQEKDITEAYGTACYLCGSGVDTDLPRGRDDSPQIDHVHPISREGCPGDVLENVRWTHARCNMIKHDRLPEEMDLPLDPPKGEWWLNWSQRSGTIADEEGPAFVG